MVGSHALVGAQTHIGSSPPRPRSKDPAPAWRFRRISPALPTGPWSQYMSRKEGVCILYNWIYIYKYIYMVLYIIWFISKLCPNYIIIYNKWCLSESKNRSVMIYLWWDRNHPCWRGPKGPELQPWMVINPQDVHGIYHILMGSIYSGRIIFIYPLRNP